MNDNWKRTLHRSWRQSRRDGWTRSRIRFSIGWLAPDKARRDALSDEVLADSAWTAAPPEDYEPEMNACEFIALTVMERPKLSELEQLVHSARAVARDFDCEVHRIGVGAA